MNEMDRNVSDQEARRWWQQVCRVSRIPPSLAVTLTLHRFPYITCTIDVFITSVRILSNNHSTTYRKPSAVEPLVHTPDRVQSARIGGIGVVDDAVL
jgi:hypothetical protein